MIEGILEYLNQTEVIKTIVILGSMGLFFVGLFGLLSQRHIIKVFISIGIMEIAVFILFIGLSFQKGLTAPMLGDAHTSFVQMNDPIPHAMILTAIVIGMAVLALGISFAIEYYKLTGKNRLDQMNEMKH